MRNAMRLVAAILVGTALAATAAADPILGQVDTFEDGTVLGWRVAGGAGGGGVHPAPPANISTGGPAGTDDNFLRLTALGGDGPGSRLAAFNTAQ